MQVVMKRGDFLISAVLLCIASIVGCSRMELPQLEQNFADAKVFYAETPSSSKTYVDTEGSVYWHEGENISVFRSTVNEKYQFQGKEGEIVNEFRKVGGGETGALYSKNYAVYPYSESTLSTEEGIFSVNIPETQHYAENSFGNEASMMVAVTKDSEDDVFYFKNVCGYLVLKIYGGDVIRSIKLTGNNGEKLSGAATLSASYGSAPQIELSQDAGTQIVLDCGEDGVQTEVESDKYTTFWVAVPPVTFENGFTVEITAVNGMKMSQSTTKSKAITQSKVMTMAAFECSVEHGHEFTSFSLSDGTNTYPAFDISNGYVNIMVPNGADLSNLVACFSYYGTYVNVNGEKQTSGVDSHNFSDFAHPLQYTVIGSDGIEQAYSIRLFNLPVLIIDTPKHKPVMSKATWIPDATIKLINPDNSEIDFGRTQIKCRGNMTMAGEKKPYTLKLDTKADILGMPKGKRWNLMANYFDNSRIRNDIALEFGRRSPGMAWNPKGEFIELILNGEHLGNYYLCEHIKIDKNRVNITEIDEDSYDPTVTYSGGYLLEFDKYFDETNKFMSYLDFPINLKSPDWEGFDITYIQNWINALEEKLTSDNIRGTDYQEYLDIDSFIDYWLITELLYNYDTANPKSCYMYKDMDSVDGKIYAGPCWDYDLASILPSGWCAINKIWYPYLFKDPEYVQHTKDRWNAQKDIYSGLANNYVDSVASLIRLSIIRDYLLWGADYDFDDIVIGMKGNLISKIQWMNKEINDMTVEYDKNPGGSEDFSGQEDRSGDLNIGF